MGFNNARKVTVYIIQRNQTDIYPKGVLHSIIGQLSKAGKISSVKYLYNEDSFKWVIFAVPFALKSCL